MIPENWRLNAVLVLMALGLIGAAVIANAPDALPYIWEIKAATASVTGIAALMMKLTKDVL